MRRVDFGGMEGAHYVGFLTHTKDYLTLRSKLARLRKAPSPEVYGEVVQTYLRLNQAAQAYEHAAEAIARFPDSDFVQELYRTARRERLENRIRDARVEIETRPSVHALLTLAQCAVEVHDLQLAFQSYRECIQRFPTSAEAYLGIARLVERRYLRDLAITDGRDLIQLLLKATQLDPSNLDAQVRLARFYGCIGALRRCRSMAMDVLAKDGRSEDARRMLTEISGENLDAEEDVEELLTAIEDSGRLPRDQSDRRRMQREVVDLRHCLPEFQRSKDVRRVVVVDVDGDAWDESGAIGQDAMVNLARNLSRSAHLATRRTHLGALRGATLESTAGAVVLRRGLRCTVAGLVSPQVDLQRLQEALGRFVATRGHREGGQRR